MSVKHVNVENLLEIAIALSAEKDYNKLLARILSEAMDMTNCDGGTLYLLSDGKLSFKIMRTVSMNFYKGAGGERIELPPVPMERKNVCACAAIDAKLINIENVYDSELYDFSGPRNYDKITGYHTESMLVIPMENHSGDIIGVLQLINAKDKNGNITAFAHEFEKAIKSLASLAAVSITNMNYIEEIKGLLESFVRVISTAIDERTPYNANHTRNMAAYAERFIRFLNKKFGEESREMYFDDSRREQLLMSVWLHDMGKMVIPTVVMNKESRLGPSLERVEGRFLKIRLLDRLAAAEGRISLSEKQQRENEIKESLEFIKKINTAGFLNDETLEKVNGLGKRTYTDENGEVKPWIEPEELKLLLIRKGTLSDKERGVMESHVVITEKLLNQMSFSKNYSKVTEFASGHHEYLDGSGYPKHKKDEELPLEIRAITILDIFDALTATDRPYKPPMPPERALSILKDMAVKEGKLDIGLVNLFEESRAWEV